MSSTGNPDEFAALMRRLSVISAETSFKLTRRLIEDSFEEKHYREENQRTMNGLFDHRRPYFRAI